MNYCLLDIRAFLTHFYEEICTSSLPIIDEFLQSVLSISPGSDSADALVSWFCNNSPQGVYKLAKSRSRANTVPSLQNITMCQAPFRMPKCDVQLAVQVNSDSIIRMVTAPSGVQVDLSQVVHTSHHPNCHSSEPQGSTILYCVFIFSAISPYTTGLKVLFNQSTAQVQPQLTSN